MTKYGNLRLEKSGNLVTVFIERDQVDPGLTAQGSLVLSYDEFCLLGAMIEHSGAVRESDRAAVRKLMSHIPPPRKH